MDYECRVVAWFSCGAASAVAAKIAVEKYGDKCVVAHCDTLSSEHPDNARFLADVERWLGVQILRLVSSRYRDIDDVFERTRYMAGIAGARCTVELKKRVREDFQQATDTHVFGFTVEERKRAADFESRNSGLHVLWPLIDAGLAKEACFETLRSAGIDLPKMYSLGFEHNNCIGCVKSTSSGYWNRVRETFPETFERRARQSRQLGVRLVRVKGRRVFLDELPRDERDPDDDIECGPACQRPAQQ